MDKAKKEALQELLRLLADNPDLADRITITIKPNSKPQQGNAFDGEPCDPVPEGTIIEFVPARDTWDF